SANVDPVSSGASSDGNAASVTSSIGRPASSGSISRSFPGFVVAIRSFKTGRRRSRNHDADREIDNIVFESAESGHSQHFDLSRLTIPIVDRRRDRDPAPHRNIETSAGNQP